MTVPGDWQRPEDPGPYPLRWCLECRFGHVHPRPERDRIPGFYENVPEHCLDPRRAVANAAGLLADRGLLAIETPNNDAKELGLAGIFRPWLDVPRHPNVFTTPSLAAICADAGLSVYAFEQDGYTRRFLPSRIRAERRIRDAFSAGGGDTSELPVPRRGSGAWRLLLSTAWAPDRLKCDSVRVISGHPSPQTKEEHP